MKIHPLELMSVCVIALCSLTQSWAQSLPTTQPKLISIVRETVKPGRSAEHAKHESGWPAAFEKAKSPYYYLAMTSLTGATEAWYVGSFENHAAIADSMKRESTDETLSKELDRLSLHDAEYISGISVVQARAMPEISIGNFPDLAKTRFFEITIMRLRPGHGSLFEEAAKAYGSAAK